jgi:hypothetical protein
MQQLVSSKQSHKFNSKKINQIKSLEVLNTVPIFKYTDNLERQLFIQEIYPYYNLFILIPLKVINKCQEYEYEGFNDIYNYGGNDDIIECLGEYNISNKIIDDKISRPNCSFFGGCVYELLYKKYGNPYGIDNYYKNVDLHKYCDATGDIDIKLFLPKLQINNSDNKTRGSFLPFFNKENKINPFFRHFTGWIFGLVVDLFTNNEVVNNEEQLYEMFPNTVEFDINEYDHISDEVKNDDFGFRLKKVANFYVVGFFEGRMFKTQIICKVVKDGITIIDHLLEFVISHYDSEPLGLGITIPDEPPDDLTSIPEFGKLVNNPLNINYQGCVEYKLMTKQIQEISFSDRVKIKEKFYIESYSELIEGNISGYTERNTTISNPEDPRWEGKKFRHKGFNHVARLFYLFEFFYQNVNLLKEALKREFKHNSDNFLMDIIGFSRITKKKDIPIVTNTINWLNDNPFFYYYKIINGNFKIIKVSFKTFFLAYLNILSMKSSSSNQTNSLPYNNKFKDFLNILHKNKIVDFIPQNVYNVNSNGDIVDYELYDGLHDLFIINLFGYNETTTHRQIHIKEEDLTKSALQIQKQYKKYKSMKRFIPAIKTEALAKDIVSKSVKDALQNIFEVKQMYQAHQFFSRNSLLQNSKKSFKKKRRAIDIMTNKKIGNPDSIRESAAKKIQKIFKKYKNKKTHKQAKSVARNSINTAFSNIHSRNPRHKSELLAATKIQSKYRSFTKKRSQQQKSSAAKKIQRKFRSFTKKRR